MERRFWGLNGWAQIWVMYFAKKTGLGQKFFYFYLPHVGRPSYFGGKKSLNMEDIFMQENKVARHDCQNK